jgi:hypothetical protein
LSKPPPHWKVINKKVGDRVIETHVGVDQSDVRAAHDEWTRALGVRDTIILEGVLNELLPLSSRHSGEPPDEAKLNYMLAQIKGIGPRDQIESMLTVQMAATHSAMMAAANTLNHVKLIPQIDSAERRFNKLARTFTTQVEALKRYRSKGEQKVTVEHVHVHDGGQAIVGNVSHPGVGAAGKSDDQSHAKQIAHAPQPEMPCDIEAERQALPVASGKGESRLPDARGQGRRAKRQQERP